MTGWDDDTSDGSWASGPTPGGGRYSNTGGSARQYDFNTAKGELAVGAYPDQARIGIPFKLRSVDGYVFMFEVEGSIEVTRQ